MESDRFSSGQVNRLGCLLVDELVKETNVGERPSGHHSVVTSTGAIGVVVTRSQTVKTYTVNSPFRILLIILIKKHMLLFLLFKHRQLSSQAGDKGNYPEL